MASFKLPQRNVSALDRGHNALVEVLASTYIRISKLEEQVAKLTVTTDLLTHQVNYDRTPNAAATQ